MIVDLNKMSCLQLLLLLLLQLLLFLLLLVLTALLLIIKDLNLGTLGKPQKKVHPLVAGPLSGGGGVKAGPLRKKELFFLFCCHLKIKIILL